MTNWPDIILIFIALAFAFMGLVSIVAPLRVVAQFDVPQLTATGRNEVRAVYGGFGLAMAAMLLIALSSTNARLGICLAIGAALAGMAGGRIVSALIDRTIGRFPMFYGAIECMGAALLFYARTPS